MAGLLAAGGTIDNLFDVVRGDIGKSDTSIQAWITDSLHQSTSRYDIQSVLYWYSDGLSNQRFGVLSGYSDSNAEKIASDVAFHSGLKKDFCWNVLYALVETSKTDSASKRILSGGGGNIFDAIMNAGPTKAVADTVNGALDSLGFPSVANTVLILAVIAIVIFIVYLRVKK